MKYTLINRKKSTEAASHTEFVKWMRRNDIQHFTDNQEFMEAYANRKSTFENIKLRFDNEDNFVADLLANKMLTINEPETKWNFFKILKSQS